MRGKHWGEYRRCLTTGRNKYEARVLAFMFNCQPRREVKSGHSQQDFHFVWLLDNQDAAYLQNTKTFSDIFLFNSGLFIHKSFEKVIPSLIPSSDHQPNSFVSTHWWDFLSSGALINWPYREWTVLYRGVTADWCSAGSWKIKSNLVNGSLFSYLGYHWLTNQWSPMNETFLYLRNARTKILEETKTSNLSLWSWEMEDPWEDAC